MNDTSFFYVTDNFSQFISREMNWEQISRESFSKKIIEGITRGNVIIIPLGSNLAELDYLVNQPEKSVYVHLYADETYKLLLNFKLIKSKSVKGIIRSYPINDMSFIGRELLYVRSIFSTFNLKHLHNVVPYLSSLVAGQVLILRQSIIKLLHKLFSVKSIVFIPGYTNLFAASVMELCKSIDASESLLQSAKLQSFIENNQRKELITFIGQKGNYWRQYFINSAKSLKKNDHKYFETREMFGGTIGANGASMNTGKEYVEGLLNSHFSLCPPGNYSSNTFRYFESLLCGSIPLVPEGLPTDPTHSAIFGPRETCKPYSGDEWLFQIQSISGLKRQELIRKSREEAIEFFKRLNEILAQ